MLHANAQNDCVDAIVVCGDTGFQGLTATGVGIPELDPFNVCSSQENNSIWLKLSINSGGTLGFILTPQSDDIEEDFDFWIFGPDIDCTDIGVSSSVRCSTTNPLLSGVFDNLTGMNDIETDAAEGPGPDGNNFVQSMTVNSGESYFLIIDRPVGFSDFSIEWTGTATFNEQPIIPSTNLDVSRCDADLVPDGFTQFNLNQNEATLLGGQTGVSVSYHTSSNDAITGTNAISNPGNFTNASNPQAIFARLTNIATDCFNTTEFVLNVTTSLTIPNNSYTVCDDGADGDPTNGLTHFNGNALTTVIFAGIDVTGYTVNYYPTAVDAVANTGALPLNFNSTIPNQQSIFVKATSPGGCAAIKEIILHVNPQPASANIMLEQCDSGVNPDGLSLFNLNDAIQLLAGNDPNLSVAFFEAGNPMQLTTNYQNTSNPQTLTAIVTNVSTGCSASSTVELTVNVNPPHPVTIAPLCDIINIENGVRMFDLTTSDLILGPTQSATFHTTENDALYDQNPIANVSNYPNPEPYQSSVFVRVEDGNSCAFISEIQLIVNKLPAVVRAAEDYFVCLNFPQQFTTIDAAITSGLPSDYTYQWYLDGVLLPNTSYALEVNQPGTFRVTVTALNCSVDRTIIVAAANHAIIESIVVDDFTAEINSITIHLSNASIGNHLFSIDNSNGPYQESGFFGNVSTGVHDLYIKELNACGLIGPIPINVLGIPKFFTPNGDGYNDQWNMNGVNAKFHKKSVISIFDRQGKLLKQVSPIGAGWDGIFNGKPLPSEDYWYSIFLEDGRTAKGHFTLKR